MVASKSSVAVPRDIAHGPGPYKIVAATGFGVLLSALDSSVVNVSLDTMSRSFGVGIEQVAWVILAYVLILTSTMPLMGKLGDRRGKKSVFQTGMALFIIGSAACALSPTLWVLIVFRLFQAIGASMMTANGLAIVTYFTTPENRGRAIGLNSVILAAALGLGPVVGGILSQLFGWPSIFLINIPLGLIGLIVGAKIIRETEPVKEMRFDILGASLFFAVLFAIVLLVSEVGTAVAAGAGRMVGNVDFSLSALLVGASVIAFAAFVQRERKFVTPMIPISVLGDRRISSGFFSALLSFMAMNPVSFLLPWMLQDVLGFNQLQTGLYLTAYPLTIAVMGPVAGLISERVQARKQTVVGLCLQLIGLVVLGFMIPNVAFMFLSVIVVAIGGGLFTVANTNYMMTAAPRSYMGVVSALTQVSRTSAVSIGTALSAALYTSYFMSFNPGGATSGPVYVNAYISSVQLAVWTFCALAGVAAIVSAFRGVNPNELDRAARRTRPVGVMDQGKTVSEQS
jgi:EmrB/QacA subfamily drug resistance transporter